MKDKHQYLIIKRQTDGSYPIKLAYWFEERVDMLYPRDTGFYHNEYYYFPYKDVIKYIDIYDIPPFTKWENEEPIEGERYLVYRVGETRFYSPHYTIRKYHNGSFGSKDVRYWIRLKDLIEKVFQGEIFNDNNSKRKQ